ncbi:calcium-binding protein [Streptococcus sp. ZJ93]|uniref:calcium-binding protein n=1 Tax=Streptococcus handemini TaxID=3161188 RepID=UPI0032EBF649
MEPKTIYTLDSDHDGLLDAQELALGTNPFSSDTDGDGKTDLEEVDLGSHPILHQQEEKNYDLDL